MILLMCFRAMAAGEGFVICAPYQWMGEGVFNALRRREGDMNGPLPRT